MSDALEPDAVEEELARAAALGARRRSASSWRRGGSRTIFGRRREGGDEAGRPRGSFGMEEVAGEDGVRRVGLGLDRRPPGGRPGRRAAPTAGRARGGTGRRRSRDRASPAARRGRACPRARTANAEPTFASSESCRSKRAAASLRSPFGVESAAAGEVARLRDRSRKPSASDERRASRPRLRFGRVGRRRASVRGQRPPPPRPRRRRPPRAATRRTTRRRALTRATIAVRDLGGLASARPACSL